MASTTYHGIPLPGDGSQDWVTVLNRALSAITEKMVRQQLPEGTTLRWGDIAGGNYLEVSASGGIRVIGGLDHGTSPARNLRLPQGDDFPESANEGSVFLRTDTGVLWYFWDGDWTQLGAMDGSAVADAGGLLVEDLGTTKGSFAVANGTGGVENVVPGVNRTVLTSSSVGASGWSLSTVLTLLGYALSKGALPVGLGGNAAAALAPGSDGEVLVADSEELSGLRWAALADVLAAILTDRGQLLAGTPMGPAAVDAPESDGQVLVADATESTGVKWVDQSELGSLPGARTRAAGDLYLYANFI
jgi:hypothetical protein